MRQRGRALVLIGFMGTGKSSAGREIARRLRLSRFDTDELVSARFGIPVAEIFQTHGEAKFRASETEVLRELNGGCEAVIVTGGGIVLKPENIEELRRLGIIVRLTAGEETLFARITRRATRPLLKTENPRATMLELLHFREPLYRAAADFEIDTTDLTHERVADEVIRVWGEGGDVDERAAKAVAG
jgi:shikimate kinase